jgi:hypothetical protein
VPPLLSGLLENLLAFFALIDGYSHEQIFATAPLAFADWCNGKVTARSPEGDALHTPSAREQFRSIVSAVREK